MQYGRIFSFEPNIIYIGSAKIVNSTAMITEMTVAVIATPDISRFASSCFPSPIFFAIIAFEPVENINPTAINTSVNGYTMLIADSASLPTQFATTIPSTTV